MRWSTQSVRARACRRIVACVAVVLLGACGDDDGADLPATVGDAGAPGPTAPAPPTLPDITVPGDLRDATDATLVFQTDPQEPTPDDELADCEARVEQAGLQVSFAPRTSMVEGEVSEVGVVVAFRGAAMTPPDGADSSPTTIVVFEDGRCTLSARLSGSRFDIDPPDAVEQSFLDVDQLSWSWQVTPEMSGRLQLRLTITPVANTGSRAIRGAERPFTADITVAAAADTRSWWDKANDFFIPPIPAAILAAVAAGVITWAMSLRRRRTGGAVNAGDGNNAGASDGT